MHMVYGGGGPLCEKSLDAGPYGLVRRHEYHDHSHCYVLMARSAQRELDPDCG
jgi:hypothetical protein